MAVVLKKHILCAIQMLAQKGNPSVWLCVCVSTRGDFSIFFQSIYVYSIQRRSWLERNFVQQRLELVGIDKDRLI